MSARPPIAIVADDLTGLQAIAAEFRKLGFRVCTFLHVGDASREGEPDIVGVDTRSRHLPPLEAAQAVRATVRGLQALGINHFYKQCDSGMQGPLAAEIVGMADVLGVRGIVYAPACPVLGRITREGRQVGAGGLDVDIGALWRQQTGGGAQLCAASQWGRRSAADGAGTWIVNAQTDAELITLATQAWPHGDRHAPPWLLAGSVGLASALAAVWRVRWPVEGARPVLVVAGSQQAQTRRQIDALCLATHSAMVPLSAEPMDAAQTTELAMQLEAALAAGCHVVLGTMAPEATGSDPSYPYLAQATRLALEHNLQCVLKALLARHMGASGALIAGVLVAGGATSELLLREVLAARSLEVEAWLAPGVAASVAHLADGVRMPIVTKAGTWGDSDVAARGIQWIVECDLQLHPSINKEHHVH